MHSDPASAALRDIAYQIGLALSFVEGFDEAAFRADLRTVYAVTRCPEIISEASRRLPKDTKRATRLLHGKTWQALATFIVMTTKTLPRIKYGIPFKLTCRRCVQPLHTNWRDLSKRNSCRVRAAVRAQAVRRCRFLLHFFSVLSGNFAR